MRILSQAGGGLVSSVLLRSPSVFHIVALQPDLKPNLNPEMTSCYLREAVQGHPAKTTRQVQTGSLRINFHLNHPPSSHEVILILLPPFSRSVRLRLPLVKCPLCLPSSWVCLKERKKRKFLIWYQFMSKVGSVCVYFSFYSHDAIWATHTSTPRIAAHRNSCSNVFLNTCVFFCPRLFLGL